MVSEHSVAENRIRTQQPDIAGPQNRSLAVTLDHDVEFDNALGCVSLQGTPAFSSGIDAVAQEIRAARVDLSRIEHTREPTTGVRLGLGDEFQGLVHSLAAGRLVPPILELMAIVHLPARRRIARRHIAPETAPGQKVDPVGVGLRQIDDGRHATREKLAESDFGARTLPLLVQVEGAKALVEPAHVHLGNAVLLADALVGGLGRGVRVDIDKTRQHK